MLDGQAVLAHVGGERAAERRRLSLASARVIPVDADAEARALARQLAHVRLECARQVHAHILPGTGAVGRLAVRRRRA